MSQCTTPSSSEAKPIQIVPKKAVLNAHGCGGDCTDPNFDNGRWPRDKVLEPPGVPPKTATSRRWPN
jgi:biotin synthase